MNKQKGFTLIELLIVIAILGILAVVAIPNLYRFTGVAKTQAKTTEMSTIQTATYAMLSETITYELDTAVPATSDMHQVVGTKNDPGHTKIYLSDYIGISAFNPGSTVLKSGNTYTFTKQGTVS